MTDHCQILVVDDDVEDHLILSEYFRDIGKERCVGFIENGQKALDFLSTIPSEEPLPKLIVLDLNMPIMNGSQTLLNLKQTSRFKNIPVIILSTSQNENEKRKCLSFGAVDYMVKPCTLEEGRTIVDHFVTFI
ncbi:response regulator [Pseudochryseolinea flava]|uniref:Response regulator n=1 Tax=Pseudochryseolinea flava TaxID=2059302 RepID=A0A364XWG3_9BACT|nr:response regulator [Pseudochryseolinea flava]RAV98709.1 response regulator [Pseudochryseolinea flava]